MIIEQFKYINIEQLMKITGCKTDFILDLLIESRKYIPELISEIQSKIDAKNWDQLLKIVSKSHSAFTILGIEVLKNDMIKFENHIIQNEKIEILLKTFEDFIDHFFSVITEINIIILKLINQFLKEKENSKMIIENARMIIKLRNIKKEILKNVKNSKKILLIIVYQYAKPNSFQLPNND